MFYNDVDQTNVFFINKITSNIRYFFFRKSFKSEGCEALCLPNLLAGGLPAGALAASIASHTRGTTPTHTLQTQNTHTRFKHNTAERNRTNDVGAQPPIVSSSFCFCCVVFEACVCFVFEVCVCVCVCGCCAVRVRSDGSRKRTCRQAPSQEIRQA